MSALAAANIRRESRPQQGKGMVATRRRRSAAKPRHGYDQQRTRRSAARLLSGLLVAVILAAAAGWAYSTSFAGVFVADDMWAIVGNPHVRTLWPLSRAMSAPPESPVSGRPVAALTLALNYALAGPDVRDVLQPGGSDAPPGTFARFLRNIWGYHFLNLGLHLLAALALFGVVRRTLLSDRLRSRFAKDATPLAGVVALVWVVHPLLTDAVTYVSQRTEVLMGLFYFLTLYCAIRAGKPDLPAAPRRLWTAGAIAACALGMGSKQTMVLAPLLVWLWDAIFAYPGSWRAPRQRWALYVGLAATWVILAALVAHERWPTTVGSSGGWTPWTYLLTQTGVIMHYLRLSVVPVPLVIDYEGWPVARSILDVAPAAALVSALFAATLVALVRRQSWGFVGAWIFATLGPSSSVLPLLLEIAAERRMYLPLAGLVVVAVIGVYLVGQRLIARFLADQPARRLVGQTAAVLLVGGVTVTFAGMTNTRNRDYWSEERIWQDAVAKRPNNPRARLNYGVVLFGEGRAAEAESQLREAVRLKDSDAVAHANLGAVLCAVGRIDEGVPHLERALALNPRYSGAYRSLGEAYGARGQRARAAEYFALAVQAEPDSAFLLSRLGWLLATSPEDEVRNGVKAVEVSERAVRITSRQDTMALATLAAAYAEAGRFEAAVVTAREALSLAERRGDQGAMPVITTHLSMYEARQKVRDAR